MSFGGAVKLTGESEYKRALSQITQNLKEVASEMKVVSTSFDSNDRSVTALAAREDVLNRKLEEQGNKLSVLKAQYASMSASYAQQTTQHNALVSTYNQEKSKLEEMARTLGTTSSAYQAQKQKVADLAVQVEKSTQAQDANEKSMSKMRTEINGAQADCNKTANELKNLGQEAQDSGKKAEDGAEGYTVYKNVLANLASTAITAAVDGLKKLADAMVNCGKQAVSNYAAYEQLVGGVETIFGDSADTVRSYAESAYKTAGLSANDYMEQVTGFSATLLQGLDNDTAQAAEYADLAIQDMSDNANKMGTDMTMITNAYQGFAKDNYTMLDNLKLGYGGTQSEMARLINDSGVLGDTVEVTAETVKDVPFDQIIAAIHKIQQNLGFTGTTAKEAATTIEGSTKSMQAAWENLLTGMADETADLDTLIDNFTSNLITNFSNTLPRIKQVVKGMSQTFTGLADAFTDIADDVAETLTDIVSEIIKAAPTFVNAMMTVVSSAVKNLVKALPEIIEAIGYTLLEIVDLLPEFITTIVTTLANGLPKIVEAATTLLMGIVQAIPKVVTELVAALPQILKAIIEGLVNSLETIVSVVGEMLFGIEDKSKKAAEAIAKDNEKIREFADALEETSPVLADYNELLSSHGNTISDLDSKIEEAEDNITNIYKAALSEQRSLRDEDIESIENYTQQIQDLQNEKLEIFRSQQTSELKKLQMETGTITQETAAQYLANLEQAYADANEATEDYYTSQITQIERKNAQGYYKTEQAYKNALTLAKGAHDNNLAENNEYYTQALALLGEKSAEWVSADAAQWQALAENAQKGGYETDKKVIDFINGVPHESYIEKLSEMDRQTAGAFLNMQASVKSGGTDISAEAATTASNILGAFEGLGADMRDTGKEALLGMVTGMEEYIPELSDTSEMSANEIVDVIKEYLDINSPSKVMEQIGSYAIQGLENGMKNENSKLTTISNTLAQTIVKAFNSNSSNMQTVGRNIAMQISQGISTNAQTVITRAQQILQNILKTFSSAAAQYSKVGKTIVEYIANAMKATSNKVTSAVLSVMKTALSQVNSNAYTFRNAGMNMAQGVAQGFLSQEWYIRSTMNAMMDRIVADVKSRMQIHSPSKVFAEIGDYMAQGLGVGFTDEMKSVTRDINSSIPATITDVTGASGKSVLKAEKSVDMVSAFKQALGEMKIELDDEVAGHFVNKTVTKLIYS